MKVKFNLAFCLLGAALMLGSCSQHSEETETAVTGDTENATTGNTDVHAGHDMDSAESNKMMGLMHENMESLQAVQRNGNMDHDFAMLMATHHEGAIKMAREEVNSGSDTMLVNMARKSIPKQEEEQKKLMGHADKHKSANGDTATTKELMQPIKTMMANMNHNMTGSTDHHFASMMSLHHQSGIEMVKAYLPKAKMPELKAMAQKTLEEQQKEKQKLDKWLQEHQ